MKQQKDKGMCWRSLQGLQRQIKKGAARETANLGKMMSISIQEIRASPFFFKIGSGFGKEKREHQCQGRRVGSGKGKQART